jgi:hypothetical protein
MAQIFVITTKLWDVLGGKSLFNEHFAQKASGLKDK